MFKVGDSVVVNGIPGVVLQLVTVGSVTSYLILITNLVARWVNGNQLSQPPQGAAAEPCIVGALPGTIQQSVTTGPYPLYLVLLQQSVAQWVLGAQINAPLPGGPGVPVTNPVLRP